MNATCYCKYLPFNGADLFTVVILPDKDGKFPTVIFRTPYVDKEEFLSEDEISKSKLEQFSKMTAAGYAVVFQHCRGKGKSGGDCIPYINERADGLFLQSWIREQSFYNGELLLCGHSYTASVHYATAPFAPDIKGAVLDAQDTERYNLNYRNGLYKMGLAGNWYVKSMYKKKTIRNVNYTFDSFKTLPLSDFSKTVFGERAENFDEILKHPKKDDAFWSTHSASSETRGALNCANIPVLLITGFYDIYTGGVFDMWHSLDGKTRSKCALAVHPFGHSGTPDKQPINFENGNLEEAFENCKLRWLDYVRGKCEAPLQTGKITYYTAFDNKWRTDDFAPTENTVKLKLGKGSVTYKYNPYAPASFVGGLSANFGGTAWQPREERYDVVTLFTPEFEKDTWVKGKISASLNVKSDCEDTAFYMRISLCKEEGDFGLRDDINQISNFDSEYQPNTEIQMSFSFDEHSFLIKKGEKLRIDISSSAFPLYVPHTNMRGPFAEHKTAKIANNTVCLDSSYIELPIA